MRLRRLAAPAALLGLVAAACSGERVASPTPSELTSLQRAAIAERLVNAAGSGDAAGGAAVAAAVIMSGAQPTRLTATRAGFTTAAAGTANAAASVASTAEGVPYNVIGFQMIDASYPDTIMGLVAWNVTADNTPTSFVVTYAFGEGSGTFDNAGDGATAFGYLFDVPSATWAMTSGTTGMLRKTVGAACDNFIYPGVQADCHLATFNAALNVTAADPAVADGNTAAGTRSIALPSGYVGGVSVEVTPSTAARVASLRGH